MAMPTVFKSSDEFNEFTYAVSQQMKSMKLATLREAIAKAAGFRHLDAYREHLDQNQYTTVTVQKPTFAEQARYADLKADQEIWELGVAICVADDVVMFQGDRYVDSQELPDDVLYLDMNGEIDQMNASYFLTGDDHLEEISAHVSSKNVPLVRGYMDVTEKPMETLLAIKHFRKTQGKQWAGEKLLRGILDALFERLTKDRVWWMDYGLHQFAIDVCGGVPLSTVSRLMGDNQLIPYDSRWLDLVPKTLHPDQMESLSSVYVREGKELHEYILHVQINNMIQTLFTFLKGRLVDPLDLEDVMAEVLASRERIEDVMALAFFNELPVKADDLFALHGEKYES